MDNTISCCFTLYVADPAIFSGLKQCPGDIIFLWELVYSAMEKINMSEIIT